MPEASAEQPNHVEFTAEIVSAYVAKNHVALSEVPALIRTVHETLANLNTPAAALVTAEPVKPAVPIKKSVTDDYIISLEDGRKFKSIKRYLAGLGMTPPDYRAKWGLPADYPMVAPAYAAKRSELARSSGLGRKPAEAEPAPAPTPAAEESKAEPAKAKRTRKAA